jgi:hypothetical protein
MEWPILWRSTFQLLLELHEIMGLWGLSHFDFTFISELVPLMAVPIYDRIQLLTWSWWPSWYINEKPKLYKNLNNNTLGVYKLFNT